MNSNVQAAMPKFAGLSHVCIFVDDMMEAVDYYQKLLGVVPDHYLSHWRNEGFFKAGGFVKEAADGDVSIAFVNVPGTKLTLELMQYHSPEGLKRTYLLRCQRCQWRTSCSTENHEHRRSIFTY